MEEIHFQGRTALVHQKEVDAKMSITGILECLLNMLSLGILNTQNKTSLLMMSKQQLNDY